jgi:anti-sigma B factor antagonist
MTIDRIGEVIVARLGTRYDAFHETEAAELEKDLCAAVGDSAKPRLVLDLSKTEYFGSSTIETLFRVWKKMESIGPSMMALAAPSPFCSEIIDVARLDSLWPKFTDVDSAVASMNG